MPLAQEQNYTIEDIYALPDGKRAELIDGRIYDMAPPSVTHQHLTGSLYSEIRTYLRSRHGTCQVFIAPFAVFLNQDSFNYFEPDISVVCSPDKLNEKGCHGAPDWIIEVLSPSTAGYDHVIKLNKYMEAGVREYWIVNPIQKKVFVYFLETNNFKADMFRFDEEIKVNLYSDFSICIQTIL